MILDELQNEIAQPATDDKPEAEPQAEVEMEMEMSPGGDSEKPGMMDETGTKIDYSSYEPVQFKKTSTLVNYFIINTAQFLNA